MVAAAELYARSRAASSWRAQAFCFFDADGSGGLSYAELREIFAAVCPFHIPDEKLEEIWAVVDANGDGLATLDEFVGALLTLQYCDHRPLLADIPSAEFADYRAGGALLPVRASSDHL